jgi:hypothetical protein
LPIIARVLRSNSIIYSDEWAAYNDLPKLNFDLKQVCHKYNFVYPVTGVHTQHVESFTNKLKMKIKESKGVRKQDHTDFLTEFMWFGGNSSWTFYKLIELLKIN